MLERIKQLLKQNKGFTLIELVVVIAILGTLAALAVPRFTSSSEAARGSKIVADMRTIDSAIAMAMANGTYNAGTAATDYSSLANVAVLVNGTPQPNSSASAVNVIITGNDNTARRFSVAANATYGISAAGRATATVADGTASTNPTIAAGAAGTYSADQFNTTKK